MNTLITKDFEIAQPINVVWKSLANPEEIVGCVPGASITEKIDDRNYKGQVVTKFGPIKAAYAGDVEIIELDEANHKMVLKGRGLDSKGKGSADMIMNGTLTEDGGKTQVNFSMDITIIGKLAQFGSRLINDVSDQLLNQFVKNFSDQLEAQTPETSAAATPAATDSETTDSEEVVAEVKKVAPSSEDNSFDGTSMIGTVIKSIFGGILDFFKGLFGIKK
ncbi:MAG: carbon monoxide dehydrogenase subunit G [Ulvibacter sp.]|jgi:carbon monoxide dehydrogenase subunit G